MKVLIAETSDFSQQAIDALHTFCDVELKDITPNELEQALNTYDVFWFRLGFKLTAEILLKAGKCKFIVCPVTGLDHIDLKACETKGIKVISLKGETTFLKHVRATAEHTLALTLALLRHIPDAVHHTREGYWNRAPFKGSELYEKTIGILGVGRLGAITAGYFKAMGAHVIGYDINPFDENICTKVDTMNDLFAQSDLVSIHVNLNDTTKHLVGTQQLNQMKKGGYLINTSRGQIVNSLELVETLNKGQLSGAAVDVIENEFAIENDVLLKYASQHPNLIITPHIGGNTWESFAKTELFMVQQLKQALGK